MSGGPKILKKGALIKQEDPAGEGQSGKRVRQPHESVEHTEQR